MNSGLEISALNTDLGISSVTKVDRSSGPAAVTGQQETSFADALKNAGTSVVNSLHGAEAASIAGIKGDAGAYEVASAVMQAEQSLRMAIAIREKAVASYKEITRMQI